MIDLKTAPYAALGLRAASGLLFLASGGLALIAGVGTRWVALALLPVLLGATYAHSSNGWLFTNEGGGWEFPASWAVALGASALLGSGA